MSDGDSMRDEHDHQRRNKDLVDRFFNDVLNGTTGTGVEELVAVDVQVHHPVGTKTGIPELMKLIGMFRGGFPDVVYVIQDRVAEADRVAVRWVATGTQTGQFVMVPPTNKRISTGGTDIFRVAGGRVAEMWVCSDLYGVFQQLGSLGR